MSEEFPSAHEPTAEALQDQTVFPNSFAIETERLYDQREAELFFEGKHNVLESEHTLSEALFFVTPAMRNYIRRRVSSNAGSEVRQDILQEVLLAPVLAARKDPDRYIPAHSFKAWLYTVAKHKVGDHFRRSDFYQGRRTIDIASTAHRHEIGEATLYDDPALDIIENQFATGALRTAMSQLPGRQREILFLRIVLGLSAEETAEAVNSTPGAVRVAQHRALSSLRKQLGSSREELTYGEDD